MIKKISVDTLKSINHLDLECKKLNIFVGTNSSGKSTTLQALLLMMQNIENQAGLNGPLVSIGEYREAQNINKKMDPILVKVFSGEEFVQLEIKGDKKIKIDTNSESLKQKMNYSNGHIQYLSCDRIGSQDVYEKNITRHEGVGINGQYAIDFLRKFKDKPLEENMRKDLSSYTLSAQVNYWLKYIVGATIKTEEIIGTDVVKASFEVNENRYSRPKNVGSGISYLVSIIIACLGSKKGDIIMIENPEIHLHPLSQSKVCEFLYFVVNAGRQIFIETHSDHIFNAVRVGIATGSMNSDNVAINFFKLGSDSCTRAYAINIKENGAIENPIPNLFDQFEIDLNKMLGI